LHEGGKRERFTPSPRGENRNKRVTWARGKKKKKGEAENSGRKINLQQATAAAAPGSKGEKVKINQSLSPVCVLFPKRRPAPFKNYSPAGRREDPPFDRGKRRG